MGNGRRRLEEQIRLAFEGGAWHGPAVLEALEGVSADQAAARPLPAAHSIWEIVLHLGAAYGLVLRRLRGDTRPLSAAEDWPATPPPTSEAWAQAVRDLRQLNLELAEAARAFPEGRLDEALIPEPAYTAYTQFIGITQHDAYHAGQIALMRRAVALPAKR